MLELENLRADYGAGTVLELDHAVFAPGQITTVLGRNGSGKSTLLRCIRGLIPCSGSVCLDGEDLCRMPPRERAKKAAYLPQNLGIPEMDVYMLVCHGRFCRKSISGRLGEKDHKAVRAAMEEADVWHLRSRRLWQLSGGERQRAYLAMVIAQDADFLLLDEPEASLDIAHQMELARLLRTLAGRGKGLIISSHDLPMSFALSDRILLLLKGKKLAEGAPKELAGHPGLMRRAVGVSMVRAEKGEGVFPFVIAT